MRRLQVLWIILVWIAALGLCGNRAQAIDRNVVFSVDNTLSSMTVEADINGGTPDSDTSALSGTINATLSVDPSGMTPLITGLNFTGDGRYSADKSPMLLDLSIGIFTVNADANNLAGTLTTPTPPASVTSGGGGDLSYTFNAANHTTSINEGILNFLFLGSPIADPRNLAVDDNAFSGPGASSPSATINLAQGATAQNLTQFTAQINFPVDFSDSLSFDFNGTQTANIRTTGTINATGSFAVDVGQTSNALLLPGDSIIAIDTDGGSKSASPINEESEKAIDGIAGANKYLNFGGANSGFIVTPGGSTQVQSMRFSTANDSIERDPATWELYGTDEAIQSLDHSTGTGGETWTLIGSGTTDTPDTRGVQGSVVSVANGTSYTHYKMQFPTTKNLGDPIMHLGEVAFFESTDGTGADVLDSTDPILAIDADFLSESDYPGGETPAQVIDGSSGTKYLNFGAKNSGFIVTPQVGSSVLDGFQITTANDAVGRDPEAWELYGTDEAIASTDNSLGDGESWTLIESGTFSDLEVPLGRETTGDVVNVTNSAAYSSYRMIFTDLRDTNDPIMQIGDIQFFGSLANFSAGDFDQDGDVDGNDFLVWQRGFGTTYDSTHLADWTSTFGDGTSSLAEGATVPEPGSLLLLMLGVTLSTPALRTPRNKR